MANESKNFLIFASGRGRCYGYMLNCDETEVTSRCQLTLNAGFELFIYEITPSPTGKFGFDPTGSTPLKRVWHLYDAHEEYDMKADDIISSLDAHSVEASREYLERVITKLQTERDRLNQPTGS